MKNIWFLLIGLMLFAAFFISSIVRESPLLLYIASAIPMFVVPFLPDIKTNQLLRPDRRGVEIVKLADGTGAAEWLVVSFKPGTVHWNRKLLLIPFQNAPTVRTIHTDEFTAALTVLKHDLRLRKGKRDTIGVRLALLAERTAGLPYTVHEVNRLIIPMADIEELTAPASVPAVRAGKVELQSVNSRPPAV